MKKESIRKKIDELKEKTQRTLNSEDVSPEVRALFDSCLILIDILVTVFLEKKTRKNSSNSGLPPSRNNGSNGNRNNPGDKDRDKRGNQVQNTEHLKTSETVSPNNCSNCDCDLRETKVSKTEERQKIDIIYQITTHTIASESKLCPECKTVNKGKFPKGMDGKVQYGIGIKASIINFLCAQMISLERVQEHFKGLVGRLISQAVMLKYIAQFSDSLTDWEDEMIKQLLNSPAIHADETSMRVDKINYWIHSYSYGDITLKFIHPKRGTEAIDEIGIIPKYGGIIIHDCYSSYFTYDNVDHALCGPHLLRELKFVEDSNKYRWATNLKKLLQGACETVGERKKMRILTKAEYQTLQLRYRNILTRALKELPDFPEPTGKRGRPKHTDAQNLWLRLREHEESVLRFARDKNVDFSNNRAERDLRISKVKQKVSGCFRTERYARCFCRISSYIKTMRYKGYSSLEAIMLALQGQIPS